MGRIFSCFVQFVVVFEESYIATLGKREPVALLVFGL